MQAKSERFEMRLEQDVLDRLDTWRAEQDDLPSRAEAIRRLIDAGLSRGSRLSFSDGERLILAMLVDLSKHMKVKNGIDPDFVAEAIFGGHLWGLEWQYQGLFHRHEDRRATVTEVCDILDMWWLIEKGYEKLSKKDKERVATEAPAFGNPVRFPGFDGNGERGHFSVARFLINQLQRFTDFKDRDLNSHMPLEDAYLRMLPVFKSIRPSLAHGPLNASQIIEILKATVHPSRRGTTVADAPGRA